MEDKDELNLLSMYHLVLKIKRFCFFKYLSNKNFVLVDDFLSSPKSASGGCGAVKCFKNFNACR
jgi:hypothetical protein